LVAALADGRANAQSRDQPTGVTKRQNRRFGSPPCTCSTPACSLNCVGADSPLRVPPSQQAVSGPSCSHQHARIWVAEWLQTGCRWVSGRARRAQFTCKSVVDRSGFEPLTSAVQTQRHFHRRVPRSIDECRPERENCGPSATACRQEPPTTAQCVCRMFAGLMRESGPLPPLRANDATGMARECPRCGRQTCRPCSADEAALSATPSMMACAIGGADRSLFPPCCI
jgi:hypothetical protein